MNAKKIILMEDDPDIAWLTQTRLQRAGYSVETADDGRCGLDQFLGFGADLLLIDIDMPGLNGWEVCSHVRSVSQVPIIMMTAYPQRANSSDRGEQSGERVIEKPFVFEVLLQDIRASLNGQAVDPAAEERAL